MGLRDISDFINKDKNAKSIGIVCLAVIIGSFAFLGKEYSNISTNLERRDYKRREAIYKEFLKAQDYVIRKLQDKELIYRMRDSYYRAIIGYILNNENNKQEEQTIPTTRNLLECL